MASYWPPRSTVLPLFPFLPPIPFFLRIAKAFPESPAPSGATTDKNPIRGIADGIFLGPYFCSSGLPSWGLGGLRSSCLACRTSLRRWASVSSVRRSTSSEKSLAPLRISRAFCWV